MADRWPRKGDKMTFLGKNGYEFQLTEAMKAFTIGTAYTVKKCEVDSWSHSVEFEEVPGSWNGVMFSFDSAVEVEPKPKPLTYLFETETVEDDLKVPQHVLDALGVAPGDGIKWVIEGQRVILEKVQ
jgi:hypothetical protein